MTSRAVIAIIPRDFESQCRSPTLFNASHNLVEINSSGWFVREIKRDKLFTPRPHPSRLFPAWDRSLLCFFRVFFFSLLADFFSPKHSAGKTFVWWQSVRAELNHFQHNNAKSFIFHGRRGKAAACTKNAKQFTVATQLFIPVLDANVLVGKLSVHCVCVCVFVLLCLP